MALARITASRRRRALARRTPSRAVRRANSSRPPRAAALALSKIINARLVKLEAVIERLLFPVLERAFGERGERALVVSEPDEPEARTRVDARIPRFVSAKLEAIEVHLIEIFDETELDRALEIIGRRVSEHNASQLQRVIGIAIREADPGVAAQIEGFRAINVSRIKSLAGQELVEITQLLERTEAAGARVGTVAKEIRERFGVTKSKANLLARDQTLSLNAQIARVRQTNLGIESYVWTTAGDDRVRDGSEGDTDHASLDGQTFRWDTPPDVGDGRALHPGEDYQCRCTAFPVLPELQ